MSKTEYKNVGGRASSTIFSKTVVLTGPRAGQTIPLGRPNKQWNFVDGKVVLQGSVESIRKELMYLNKCYGVVEEESDGEHNIPQAAEQRTPASVPSDIRPFGQQSEKKVSDVSGTDDGNQSDSTEHSAGEESGLERPEEELGLLDMNLPKTSPEVLRACLATLDHKNPKQWTNQGLPNLRTVCEITKNPYITRAQISEAWPGLKRESQRESQE